MTTAWKIYIAILLFLLVSVASGYVIYTKAWVTLAGKISLLTPLAKNNAPPQSNIPTKTYSNPDMHISFNYPSNLQLTIARPHLISIANASSTSEDSTLYIFETSAPSNAKVVDIPFVIKGKLQKQTPVPIHDFTAMEYIYSDGIDFLTLRKGNEFIMVRIPKDSSGVADAITEFVDTVKVLK